MFSRSDGIETGPELSLRDRLNQGLAVAGSVLTLAGGVFLARDEVLHTGKAEAYVECSSSDTTITTNPDGTTTTTTDTSDCPPDGQQAQPQKPDQPEANPPKKHPNHPKHKGVHSGKTINQPKGSDKYIWPDGFINYNQGDWPYPSTGCGPTALAMVLATLEGSKHITPATVTSNISPEWYSPGNSGTAPGAFFDMGKKYGLSVDKSNLKEAKKVLLAGGLAIVHAARGSGHFTMNGHYMVLKRVQDGKFRIADPNGDGYSNDSENKAWSVSALKRDGIDQTWTFQVKK